MLVALNSRAKRDLSRFIKKKEKPIAESGAGDQDYYITKANKKKNKKLKKIKRKRKYEDDDDYDDYDDDFPDEKKRGWSDDERDLEEEDSDLEIGGYDQPVETLSGADWRPKFNDRLTMFIAGAPGAGKSYLAKEMIKLLPPNIPILLFTALTEKDGNFSELGTDRLYQIKMKEDVLKKIDLKQIREKSGSKQMLLLFDDVDKIRDPKIQNLTFAIMNDALANGRGHEKHDGDGDIHVICTSHSANDYQKTKYTFENSNYVALFPGASPALQMYRMFEKLGLEKELCQEMMRLGRKQEIRSIIVHKVVPMYLIYGDKMLLI